MLSSKSQWHKLDATPMFGLNEGYCVQTRAHRALHSHKRSLTVLKHGCVSKSQQHSSAEPSRKLVTISFTISNHCRKHYCRVFMCSCVVQIPAQTVSLPVHHMTHLWGQQQPQELVQQLLRQLHCLLHQLLQLDLPWNVKTG